MHNHPCRCDKCYAARDAELARAREGMAQMLEVEARARAVGPQRLALFVAAKAVRRGRFLTDAEKLENLKTALAE